jgi:hypothetical protein
MASTQDCELKVISGNASHINAPRDSETAS